ncbi:MAG: Asp-tRNA(Asn)/Glu-tRNA(Gln) amidotransferase subunit GatC [Candidatus Aenigmarchaeota archaeon]|nr:Asp-tRNA(Asn)/Glu-tRNA(Gln) amidotransferase subunit GatC [Candidatus Aenigmarchaeota archaeon]
MTDYRKIDKELLERVSDNARLKLSDEEIEKFTKQLEDIIDAFKSLDEVDTKNVKPSFHPQEISDVYREDKAEKFDWNSLANTKHKEGKHFKGPKIV